MPQGREPDSIPSTKGQKGDGSSALSAAPNEDGIALGDAPRVAGRGSHVLGPHVVRRPRLVARLRDAADSPLLLLVAPAGYGKTTVLSEWAAQDGRPLAWIALDAADNDPAALVRSIVRELERIEPVEPGVLSALAAPEPSMSGIVLPRLARSLSSQKLPFVLVLEDLHRLHGRESLEVVAAIADHLPSGAQLALTSRTQPPVGLGRMRAHRRLVELHARHLAMTSSEGLELLDGIGVQLADADLEAVMARTEGWPAALYLAGLSLREQPDIGEAVARFAGDERVIVEYLRDEFLSRISPDALEFLTRSSVLDVLSGPVCDAVLRRSGSARVLRGLARSNMLVVPLDRNDHAYRYHSLFADMLHAELDRLGPRLAPELHRRASEWYAEQEDYDRAVPHAIAARDLQVAGDLLWEGFPALISRGRNATIRQWLDRFTDAQIAAAPLLAVSAAHSALAGGQGARAEHLAAVAEAGLDGDLSAERRSAAESASLIARAELGRDGVLRMAEDAARAAELQPDHSPWRSPCCLVEGVAARLVGERERARTKLEEGVRRGAVGAPVIEVICAAELALLAIDEGDREEAARLASRARAQVERCGLVEYESNAVVFAVLALVGALEGRVEAAKADADRSLGLLRRLNDFGPWYVAETQLTLARARLRLDEVDAARALLVAASRWLRRTPDATVLREGIEELWAAIDTSSGALAGGRLGLTPAELRVLQFLPTHLSFREIAECLYVSANTIKTQARAVYRKLDVSSRAEAVERAQRAGLLDTERPVMEFNRGKITRSG